MAQSNVYCSRSSHLVKASYVATNYPPKTMILIYKAFFFARVRRFSSSRKVTPLCVWCSLSRRASRDLLAETFFSLLGSQLPSSLIARLDLSSDCTLLCLAV